MTKLILVSDPDPHGESHHALLCREHLESAMRLAPLGAGEYVLDADEDADCEECGPVALVGDAS
jgi:hypothetical protein